MFQTFEEFLTVSRAQIPLFSFIINLVFTAILSFILSKIYDKYGTSLSNRKMFSKNFLLIAMTTMLIITIVKSSLALSLGLVGALSIIRFRTAIKEPEELAFLFLAIGLGLGFGADQTLITIIAFTIISIIVIILKTLSNEEYDNQNLYLTINSANSKKPSLNDILNVLNQYCSAISLKRLDETKEITEISFLVEFDHFEQLNKAKNALNELDDKFTFSFLDNRGL